MKLDLRKEFKSFYAPSAKEVQVVDVPPLQFAMLGGQIEPGQAPGSSPAFQEALAALYGISYTLKFISKLRPTDPLDYTVIGLKGVIIDEGDTYEEALADVKSAIAFHIDTFGPRIFQADHPAAGV